MSDRREFNIVMLVSATLVVWMLHGSLQVLWLNHQLRQDPVLEQYPYGFRVIRQEDGEAVVGVLHTGRESLVASLRLMFPELADSPDDSWAMRLAEKEYARMQARAQQIVSQQGQFDLIRWELDETWLRLQRKSRSPSRDTDAG